MTPKEECEALLDFLDPLAANMLAKNGEFFPFGAAMHKDKTIKLTSHFDGNEQPQSTEVINNLENIFKKLAEDEKIIASAIVYNAKINKNEENVDAIIFSLEHIDNYTVKVAYPYKIRRKLISKKTTVDFGEVFAFEGDKNIFVK